MARCVSALDESAHQITSLDRILDPPGNPLFGTQFEVHAVRLMSSLVSWTEMNPPRSSFVLLLPHKLLALRIPRTIEVYHGVLQIFGLLHRTCELPNCSYLLNFS